MHDTRDDEAAQMRAPAASMHGFSWRAFLLELAIYAALVLVYFFLVLHFLGGWLAGLFDDHRTLYAFVALALIAGQGVALEAVTSGLLRVLRARLER